jgi:hypothetical protein
MPTELIRKQFLLTKEENLEIEKKAESKGLSVSNYTRVLHGLEPLKKGMPSKKNVEAEIKKVKAHK